METKAPVPGELLPIELMNTIWADRDGVHDALGGPHAAAQWLASVGGRADLGPVPGDLSDDRVIGVRVRRLRDALRRLAAEATDDHRLLARSATEDLRLAVEEVNAAAAAAPRWSELDWHDGDPTREVRTSSTFAAGFVSVVAGQAIELFADEVRTKLRACGGPGCVLYFVKSHPRREWCSAGCGNRARVARHYRRSRASAEQAPGRS